MLRDGFPKRGAAGAKRDFAWSGKWGGAPSVTT